MLNSYTVESSIPEGMTIHEWRHRKVTRGIRKEVIFVVRRWLHFV